MENSISISPGIKANLLHSVTWAKYAAILSFINLGLALVQMIVGAIKGDMNIFGSLFSLIISGVITLVMSVNLYRYSTHARNASIHSDSESLREALYHLKVYFIVMGVLFLIIIGLLALFILIALIAGIIAVLN